VSFTQKEVSNYRQRQDYFFFCMSTLLWHKQRWRQSTDEWTSFAKVGYIACTSTAHFIDKMSWKLQSMVLVSLKKMVVLLLRMLSAIVNGLFLIFLTLKLLQWWQPQKLQQFQQVIWQKEHSRHVKTVYFFHFLISKQWKGFLGSRWRGELSNPFKMFLPDGGGLTPCVNS